MIILQYTFKNGYTASHPHASLKMKKILLEKRTGEGHVKVKKNEKKSEMNYLRLHVRVLIGYRAFVRYVRACTVPYVLTVANERHDKTRQTKK